MFFVAPKVFSLNAVCLTSMSEGADTPDYTFWPQQAVENVAGN